MLRDDDEGVAEALRREEDFAANQNFGLSLDDLDQQIKNRRI
jgi:hypothetical protein